MKSANLRLPSESPTEKKQRCERILEALIGHYGLPGCTLLYHTHPWRLLVGGILAAQCTDERVNQITPAFFERYPDIADVAAASPTELEPYIKSCGLFRNKAKWIYGSALKLMQDFDGEVPQTRKELMTLPGVGRKIANLLLSDVFGQQAIVVDTHCGRISRLLGLTQQTDPLKAEKDLMACVPEQHWTDWGHLLVTHGREVCIARRPRCEICVIRADCMTGGLMQSGE